MRNRITFTERVSENMLVSQSFYPDYGRPSGKGLAASFLIGFIGFFVIGFLLIAVL